MTLAKDKALIAYKLVKMGAKQTHVATVLNISGDTVKKYSQIKELEQFVDPSIVGTVAYDLLERGRAIVLRSQRIALGALSISTALCMVTLAIAIL